jgi:hypothetical protein
MSHKRHIQRSAFLLNWTSGQDHRRRGNLELASLEKNLQLASMYLKVQDLFEEAELRSTSAESYISISI